MSANARFTTRRAWHARLGLCSEDDRRRCFNCPNVDVEANPCDSKTVQLKAANDYHNVAEHASVNVGAIVSAISPVEKCSTPEVRSTSLSRTVSSPLTASSPQSGSEFLASCAWMGISSVITRSIETIPRNLHPLFKLLPEMLSPDRRQSDFVRRVEIILPSPAPNTAQTRHGAAICEENGDDLTSKVPDRKTRLRSFLNEN